MTAPGHLRAVEGAVRAVLEALEGAGTTLGVAESCTGGLLGAAITAVPGASRAFLGGVIAYDDRVKEELLGVEPRSLAAHGAVSGPVALAMAEGVRRALEADWGVAITGVAGPGGGRPDKPVGTVWVATAGPGSHGSSRRFAFPGDRGAVRDASVVAALEMLREGVDGRCPGGEGGRRSEGRTTERGEGTRLTTCNDAEDHDVG